MPKEYDNTNRGALFANDDKRGENDPNAKGSLNVDGVEYWVSAWTKTSKAGQRYQSLSVRRKEAKQETPKAAAPADFDDDLPF